MILTITDGDTLLVRIECARFEVRWGITEEVIQALVKNESNLFGNISGDENTLVSVFEGLDSAEVEFGCGEDVKIKYEATGVPSPHIGMESQEVGAV